MGFIAESIRVVWTRPNVRRPDVQYVPGAVDAQRLGVGVGNALPPVAVNPIVITAA